jgi:hypothetical protein
MKKNLSTWDIIEYLKKHGFRKISKELTKSVLISEDYTISVTVEETMEELTEEEELKIKKRLKELGYL